MIVNIIGETAIVSQERTTLESFLEGVKLGISDYKELHLVLHLLTDKTINSEALECLLTLSTAHRAKGKSFVVVTDMLSYEEAPETLEVVPTLQEAKDVIEMEEIERDLGI